MVVQSSGTPSTSRKTQSSESVSRNVVNPVTYPSSGSGDESDSTFMGSGKHWRVYYEINHATSQCRRTADSNKFVVSRNSNYQSRFCHEGDFKRLNTSRPTRQVARQKATTSQTPYTPRWNKKKLLLYQKLLYEDN